jgi:hypothetical protein
MIDDEVTPYKSYVGLCQRVQAFSGVTETSQVLLEITTFSG